MIPFKYFQGLQYLIKLRGDVVFSSQKMFGSEKQVTDDASKHIAEMQYEYDVANADDFKTEIICVM